MLITNPIMWLFIWLSMQDMPVCPQESEVQQMIEEVLHAQIWDEQFLKDQYQLLSYLNHYSTRSQKESITKTLKTLPVRSQNALPDYLSEIMYSAIALDCRNTLEFIIKYEGFPEWDNGKCDDRVLWVAAIYGNRDLMEYVINTGCNPDEIIGGLDLVGAILKGESFAIKSASKPSWTGPGFTEISNRYMNALSYAVEDLGIMYHCLKPCQNPLDYISPAQTQELDFLTQNGFKHDPCD